MQRQRAARAAAVKQVSDRLEEAMAAQREQAAAATALELKQVRAGQMTLKSPPHPEPSADLTSRSSALSFGHVTELPPVPTVCNEERPTSPS